MTTNLCKMCEPDNQSLFLLDSESCDEIWPFTEYIEQVKYA